MLNQICLAETINILKLDDLLQYDVTIILEKIYSVLAKFLGTPPSSFDFEYLNKDSKYCCVEHLTPQSFFEKYVKEYCNLTELVVAQNYLPLKYEKAYLFKAILDYSVDYTINLKIKRICKLIVNMIDDGQCVVISCDIKRSNTSALKNVFDDSVYNFDKFLCTQHHQLSKSNKQVFNALVSIHTIVVVGYKKIKGEYIFEIANSWGKNYGNSGYFSVTERFLKDNLYTAQIDKKFLTNNELLQFENPIVCDLYSEEDYSYILTN